MLSLSSADISGALLYGSNWWGGSVVTYSVPGAGAAWSGYAAGKEPADPGYLALNGAQAARFVSAIEAWDAVVGLSLNRVQDGAEPGQIRVAFTNVDNFQGDAWGYATAPPNNGGSAVAQNGDIWIDDDKASSAFADTGYDYMALIHEIGHALGLKHPFENGASLPAAYDNHRYTVMSYTPYTDYVLRLVEPTATGIRTVVAGVYPTTPMVLDVLALQTRYGADPDTNAGATTYSWSQSTPIMQTLYDAGGIDTIDLSSHTRGSIIDLTPGAYSSVAYYSAEAQAADWTSLYPWAADFLSQQLVQASTYTWSNNLGIAYGTVIENVTGGAGADTVTGNDAANVLLGGGGGDHLRGREGDDTIRGGDGGDDINGNQGADLLYGGQGGDWVVGGQDNDRVYGDDGDDIVNGNLGDDVCEGGAGADIVRGGQGDDTLSGGAGDDWMAGDRGSDLLSGGAGADTFHFFAGAGIDRVADFNLGEGDRVLLVPGQTYALSQAGADVVVDLGAGDQLILVGVSMSALTGGNWLA